MANLNIDSVKDRTFDAIVIGSGMSGGWAAKELTGKGLKTLMLERGRDVKHIKDYPTTNMYPWEFEHRGVIPMAVQEANPVINRCYAFREDAEHFFVKDHEHPYVQEKPFDWIRGYQVGGKSLMWARQTQRWSDFDFEGPARDGFAVDWPIRYKDIAPWYSYVEKFAGISGNKDGIPELPDGDGVGLIRRFREQPELYRTPIVIMSKDRTWEKSGNASNLNVRDWIEKPINIDHLAQILDGAVAREPNGRPHILHVDDDGDVLDLVADVLRPTASVTSVASIEEAHRALLMNQFDLAVLDMNVGSASGLDLLPALRRDDGAPIPVIIFSAYAENLDANPQVEANLNKVGTSFDNLVAAVHDRLMLRSAKIQETIQ